MEEQKEGKKKKKRRKGWGEGKFSIEINSIF